MDAITYEAVSVVFQCEGFKTVSAVSVCLSAVFWPLFQLHSFYLHRDMAHFS